jgi:hypothetical protein
VIDEAQVNELVDRLRRAIRREERELPPEALSS